MLPQAGHAEQCVIRQTDAVWLFTFAHGFPFVEGISRDQAVTPLVGIAEGWFVGKGFGASVDELCTDGWILGPGRNQAPLEQRKLPPFVHISNHRDHLTGCDVVMRGEIWRPEQLEAL